MLDAQCTSGQEKRNATRMRVEELEKIRDQSHTAIAGGDFNAHHPSCGSGRSDDGDKAVKEKLEKPRWSLHNDPTNPTRIGQKSKESDATFDLTWKAGTIRSEWRVGPDPWGSDHQPIFINMKVSKNAKKRAMSVKWDSLRYEWYKAGREQDFAGRIRKSLREATTGISVKEDCPTPDLHLLNLFENRLTALQ